MLGNVGVVTLSQADWCRFAKNGNRIPMIAQIVACPLMIYAACMWNFPPLFFSFAFFFKGEGCVAFGWSWGSWYADADDGEI